MHKLLAVVLLAACGGSQNAAAPAKPNPDPPNGPDRPLNTSDDGRMGNDAPPSPIPSDAASRKHAFVRTAAGLPWMSGVAVLAPDLYMKQMLAGGAFDITEGPVVVVSGKVTNEQRKEVAYWAKKPHRIECAKGANCILLVHKDAPAESKELLASDLRWQPLDPSRPDPLVVPLWGDGTKGPSGFLMKMKAGGGPFWHIHRNDYSGVVLVGNVVSYESGHEPEEMSPGSYWWQPNGNKHTTDCKGPEDCVIYLDFTGAFDVKPVP